MAEDIKRFREIHEIPEDNQDHYESPNCWCGPKLDTKYSNDEREVWIHHRRRRRQPRWDEF